MCSPIAENLVNFLMLPANLRGLLPHVESLMMDQQTFDAHVAYVVDGTANQVPFFDGLTYPQPAQAMGFRIGWRLSSATASACGGAERGESGCDPQ